jgi:uncharacterized membrane protein
MIGWCVAVFAFVRSEYVQFHLARFDLGNMVQAVWSTTQGRPLETTTAAGEQMTRLGAHVDPILVLLTPLWLLVPSPLTLALVQIVAVALGALPVFWLARKHLGSEMAAGLLALAYLASPWIAWTASDAMHPKTFAIPLFLFAVWFLDEDRLVPFGVVAVLAAASGELMGMTIAALGVWYAVGRGRRRAGIVVAALGATWTLVALEIVVPAFSGGSSVYYGLYESVGGSPAGIVRTALTDPGAIASALSGRNEILYVFLLAAPLAGAFLLAPLVALVAVPQLLVNALADADGPTDPRHHYIAAIIPFLFAAAAIGLGRLPASRRVSAAGFVLGLSVVFGVLLGPWPGPIDRVPIRYELAAPAGHVDVLRRAVALVPDAAAVSTSNKVGSHLAARRYLFMIPVLGGPEARAGWVVLDTYDPWLSYRGYPFLVDRPQVEIQAFRDRMVNDPAWEIVMNEGGVYVFRRVRA